MKRFATDDVLFGKLRPYSGEGDSYPIAPGVCVSEFLVLRSRKRISSLPTYLEQLLRSKRVH